MNSNPFIKEAFGPEDILGKKEEIAGIATALDDAISGKRTAIAILGPAGIGKSLLMERGRALAARSRCLIGQIKVQRKERIHSMKKRLLESLLEHCGELIVQTALPFRLERFFMEFRQQIEKESFESENADKKFVEYIMAVSNKTKEQMNAIAFFIDDADRCVEPNGFATKMLKIAMELQKQGIKNITIISISADHKLPDEYKKINMKGLNEHDMQELASKLLKPMKIEIGDECMKSIIQDSEGNPTVFFTICRVLFSRISEKEKVITKGHYLAGKSAIMSALARELFDSVYQNVSPAEKRILAVLAKQDSMRVSEISEKLGTRLGNVTRLVLRLVEQGNIVRLERGRYKLFNRLYGKYVTAR